VTPPVDPLPPTEIRVRDSRNQAHDIMNAVNRPAAEMSRPIQNLVGAQLAWALHDEALWRKAEAIVAGRPDLDTGDVYHALRALELTPAERLRRGLTRVRVRPHTR
jgi:hypothetical protein